LGKYRVIVKKGEGKAYQEDSSYKPLLRAEQVGQNGRGINTKGRDPGNRSEGLVLLPGDSGEGLAKKGLKMRPRTQRRRGGTRKKGLF